MPDILHSNLTNSEIHEPKGVASAANGTVYVADGAGSGAWALAEPKGIDTAATDKVYVSNGSGGGVWKTLVNKGWENIDHGGVSQSLTSGVRTLVLNDGAGPATITTYQLPDSTGSVWDASTNSFDWSAADLKVGDTVDIRFDIDYTVNSANDGFLFEIDLGIGSATNITLPIDNFNIDVAGTQKRVPFKSFFIGNEDILNNPAQLYVTADSASDSISVNGWYVRVNPLNPRFS